MLSADASTLIVKRSWDDGCFGILQATHAANNANIIVVAVVTAVVIVVRLYIITPPSPHRLYDLQDTLDKLMHFLPQLSDFVPLKNGFCSSRAQIA